MKRDWLIEADRRLRQLHQRRDAAFGKVEANDLARIRESDPDRTGTSHSPAGCQETSGSRSQRDVPSDARTSGRSAVPELRAFPASLPRRVILDALEALNTRTRRLASSTSARQNWKQSSSYSRPLPVNRFRKSMKFRVRGFDQVGLLARSLSRPDGHRLYLASRSPALPIDSMQLTAGRSDKGCRVVDGVDPRP